MRLGLFSALEEIERFSIDEIIKVGEYISKDAHKVDYFFALPNGYHDYVGVELL